MLVSEVKRWHWLITWDNPQPADSSSMLAALGQLGKLTGVQAKTTYLLAPYGSTTWRQIRNAISGNLNPSKGNVVYVNLRSGNIFEYGRHTGKKWVKVN